MPQLFGDVLRNTPKDIAGIKQCEVTHGPGLVLRVSELHSITRGDSRGHDMTVPVIDVLNEQVHLKVLDELRFVEGLQKKACVSVPDIGDIFV